MGDVVIAKRKGHFWSTDSKYAYLFLLPATVFILVFMIYPILNVIIMSLYHTHKLGRFVHFNGFKNFANLFQQEDFLEVMLRSVYWTGLAVAVKTIFGLVLALLLNVEYKGRKVLRALIIIPWASAVPISALLWRWVYHHEFGLLNHTLKSIGLWADPPVWLGRPVSAFFSVIWVDIWIGIPFMTLVFLAGMQAISQDLYEAAEVDGATGWQKYWNITLPLLRPAMIPAIIIGIMMTFNQFNIIFFVTEGGPIGLTEILVTQGFKLVNPQGWYGVASAFNIIVFVILAIITLITNRVSRATEPYYT